MKGALRMTISDTGDSVLFEVVCKVCGQTISRDTMRVGAGDDAIVAAAGADAATAREHLRRCPGAAAGVPAGRPGPAHAPPARTAGAGGRPAGDRP